MAPSVIYPRPLVEGDKIAVVSPASRINPDYVSGAVKVLRSEGWEPVIMPHALCEAGTFSGTREQRLSDITEAFVCTDYRAVLCSRGGYGAVHLLSGISQNLLTDDPKWLIGFSDISALHALMSHAGVASIHGSMCKHLALKGGTDDISRKLFSVLRGVRPVYKVKAGDGSRQGKASGRLAGGNMAVLGGLVGTPYDIYGCENPILFFEDIAEPIYKVERMLYQLKLAGVLDRARGIIVGRFTEYKPDINHKDVSEVFRQFTDSLDCPVVYDFPVGHIDENLPLIESADVTLEVRDGEALLSF